MEYLFQVTAKIEVNEKEMICKTWTSSQNYDSCYFQIEKTEDSLRKSKDDKIVTHILHASVSTFPSDY